MRHLIAWFWVIKVGHVSAEVWQPWADAMIERMDCPPGWICDMSMIESRHQLYRAMVGHQGAWGSTDLIAKMGELAISMDYLAFRRGEMSLRELISRAAANPQPLRIGTQADFQVLEQEYCQALELGERIDEVEALAVQHFAKYFPEAALFFSMTHDPLDQVAREIIEAR